MADEQDFLRKLVKLAERWHALRQRRNGPEAWEIQPGSPLAGDESKSHPHQIAPAAWHALTVAEDHLLCLRSSLREHQQVVIHTHGQYTLVRAGLENAARAVWLLRPKDRRTRITRRLAMQRNEVRAQYRMRDLLNDPGPRTKEKALEELNTLLASALGVPNDQAEKALKTTPCQYRDMVRDAAPEIGLPADSVELVWSACSSLAHGDTHGTLSVLDKEVSAARSVKGHKMAVARVTGSVSGLYWSAVVASLMVDAGYDLYAQRARAPFSP